MAVWGVCGGVGDCGGVSAIGYGGVGDCGGVVSIDNGDPCGGQRWCGALWRCNIIGNGGVKVSGGVGDYAGVAAIGNGVGVSLRLSFIIGLVVGLKLQAIGEVFNQTTNFVAGRYSWREKVVSW
ncbi:hypothetical protein Ddye_027948 [Dipteronia dyeriana]|uniref:Uncharacterized protein n=1 Tax=Dipteronia dyeriana TaxID=168575 RepID=A0AAD9TQJ4_9ROSI|nr:hypothetical protein Ddye_027948 [Dipteronia dyeriana]